MDKLKALSKISQEIQQCEICKIGKSGKAVPGEGNPDAKIIFIGEAPGKKESEEGKPFIGRSGQLLRKLIKESGLLEEEVFITSPVKYLPDRGTPSKRDIEHGMIHTKKQLDVINPKIIVLLGLTAIQGILGEMIPIKKEHGEVFERNGKTYFLTFHPSAGLRFPPLKKLLEEDFKKLKDILKPSLT